MVAAPDKSIGILYGHIQIQCLQQFRMSVAADGKFPVLREQFGEQRIDGRGKGFLLRKCALEQVYDNFLRYNRVFAESIRHRPASDCHDVGICDLKRRVSVLQQYAVMSALFFDERDWQGA